VADYTESNVPAWHRTYTAGAAITGGQLVIIGAADNTVIAATGAANEPVVGIAAHDAVSGDTVTVARGGVQRPLSNGAIARGSYVKSAASAQVALFVVGTDNPISALGIAIEAGTNGNPVRVLWRV
jgi:Uncharacterized conserved protein (DUF2190)